LAEWLHSQVATLLAPVLGICSKPSYSFVSAYAGGATLPLHSDRPQCEITVSLCVFATAGGQRWPLHLQSLTEDTLVEMRLGVGQAAIFKGREIPHSRPALPANAQSISLLFHFVDDTFNGSLD
jgi:hypothetical protein